MNREATRRDPIPLRATGFIYVVPSVGTDYLQPSPQQVPTWFEGRIYFGPCKIPMRPRMQEGDYIFGISPSTTRPRRIVFAARIAEKLTYAAAYKKYPKIRGPDGPIHVRPTKSGGMGFPECLYEHIPGANHPGGWQNDIRTPELDAFFVCESAVSDFGRWLGGDGPVLTVEVLDFLKACTVYGVTGRLGPNSSATGSAPVAHGKLFRGLHAETAFPETFLDLVLRAMSSSKGSPSMAAPKEIEATRQPTRKAAGARRYACGSAKRADPKVLLVRVGADQTEGGGQWNGPVDVSTRRFVYVPIPETKSLRDRMGKAYSALVPALKQMGQALPTHLADRMMHLDPDFEFLTYGDRGSKGQQLASTLERGDLIVFYSGLRATQAGSQLVYAIIGALRVDEICRAIEVRQSDWYRNAHTRRELKDDADDVIVVGARRGSGRLSRAIPIGEYRAGAYRVNGSLLELWGGLSARDGFLQRSAVFPTVLEPKKFLNWWDQQASEMLAENNPK